MKKYFLSLLMIFISSDFIVTQDIKDTHFPEIIKIEDYKYYSDYIHNVKSNSYLNTWTIDSIRQPFRYENSDVIIAEVYFSTSNNVSSFGINYLVQCDFYFRNNNLLNSQEIELLFNQYSLNIYKFESDKLVRYFINKVNPKTLNIFRPFSMWRCSRETSEPYTFMSYYEFIIKVRESKFNFCTYDFIKNNICGCNFNDKLVLNNIDYYLPIVKTINERKEFIRNCGLSHIKYEDNKIIFTQDTLCYECGNYFIYDFNWKVVSDYSLENNFDWESFPTFKLSHRIIEKEVFKNEYKNYQIGKENYWNFTKLKCRNHPDAPYRMEVAIIKKFDNRIKTKELLNISTRKNVVLILRKDGSHSIEFQ